MMTYSMLPSFYRESDKDIVFAGIDEVGRGPLAGPVVACCVVWPQDFNPKTTQDVKFLEIIKDSKKLSVKKRQLLDTFIKQNAIEYSIGSVGNEEIDEINILQGTFKAMHIALDKLKTNIEHIYVDGNKFKIYMTKEGEFVPHTCIVNGDNQLLQIAMASIVAKVYRDDLMTRLHDENPEFHPYCWNKNKGYGTKQHMDAIKSHGMTLYHRKSFVHLNPHT